jgi:hypothetical protein
MCYDIICIFAMIFNFFTQNINITQKYLLRLISECYYIAAINIQHKYDSTYHINIVYRYSNEFQILFTSNDIANTDITNNDITNTE